MIGTLLSTGALPERSAIRPEHQPVLALGQDAVLAQMYAADPLADAARVTAPGGGRPPDTATRDQDAVGRIADFLASRLNGARR